MLSSCLHKYSMGNSAQSTSSGFVRRRTERGSMLEAGGGPWKGCRRSCTGRWQTGCRLRSGCVGRCGLHGYLGPGSRNQIPGGEGLCTEPAARSYRYPSHTGVVVAGEYWDPVRCAGLPADLSPTHEPTDCSAPGTGCCHRTGQPSSWCHPAPRLSRLSPHNHDWSRRGTRRKQSLYSHEA